MRWSTRCSALRTTFFKEDTLPDATSEGTDFRRGNVLKDRARCFGGKPSIEEEARNDFSKDDPGGICPFKA